MSQMNPMNQIIDGIFLLNKSKGISSNHALQRVKRFYNAKKAGHTGSLDPLATGLLPICFGKSTKLCQQLLESDKIYTVIGCLGATTITGDAEGDVQLIANAPTISLAQIEGILPQFLGPIKQIPPMYSALKKEGVPLYKLARQGIEIERPAREVTIHSIKLNAYNAQESHFDITVHCTKGTYIRTLVEDIGKALDSGAYVLELCRDKTGPYDLKDALTLDQLNALSLEEAMARLII